MVGYFWIMKGKFRVAFGQTIRTLHRFWLEIVGALFLTLSIFFVTTAVSQYRMWSAGVDQAGWVFALAVIFAAVMLVSALHSFWKARKIR